MSNPVFAQLLILFLLIVNSSRIFFLKYGKIDTLTVLSPICAFLSIMQIAAWNADLFSIILFAISFFSFVTNFRALMRFISNLYVDHYSKIFKISSVLIMILCILETCLIIYFFPVIYSPESLGASETQIKVTGNFISGLKEADSFEPVKGKIYLYESINKTNHKNQTVIFLPDKRAENFSYRPYLCMLAAEGYSVYSADLYTNDLKWVHNNADSKYLRRSYMIYRYLKDPACFEPEKEFYTYNSIKEYSELLRFIKEKRSYDNFFLAGDWMAENAMQDFYKLNSGSVSGYFCLTQIDEYKTKGFGCIEQTEPFLAHKLGIKRETSFYLPKLMAEKSKAAFKEK